MQKKPTVTIITPKTSKRLQYVCQWVFEQCLQIRYAIITPENSNSFQTLSLAYGMEDNRAAVAMKRGMWIDEGYSDTEIPGKYEVGRLILPIWEKPIDDELPDVFSAIFWSLSRAEEYCLESADKHGRFPSKLSWASKFKVLESPWVDIAVEWLADKLGIEHSKSGFRVLPSFDIDEAYAFKSRSWRVGAGLINDILKGRYRLGIRRLKWMTGLEDDPFDTYQQIDLWLESLKSDTYVFFLLGDYKNSLDRNIKIQSPELAQIINEWVPPAKLGLHPSYGTLENPELLYVQKHALEKIAEMEVRFSRFHFLRFQLPESYRLLIEAGITEDHSMIYPDAIGFRAGTGIAFNWYDAGLEVMTPLLVYPYCIMDRTLKDYMRLSPDQAKMKLQAMVSDCKKNGIPLAWIWHNSTMGKVENWNSYEIVRDQLV